MKKSGRNCNTFINCNLIYLFTKKPIMAGKKAKEPKKTFFEEVLEVLNLISVSRKEKGKLVEKIDELAEKHFK
jgi:hypothetical protein